MSASQRHRETTNEREETEGKTGAAATMLITVGLQIVDRDRRQRASVTMSNTGGGDFSSAYPIISRSDLVIGQQLGCGSFGSVYRAVWKSRNMTVALKKVFMLEKEVCFLFLLPMRK